MAIEVGNIFEGRVTGVKPFGAFVALPEGRVGMVHISEVSNEFVQDIAAVLHDGDTVKVQVINVAPDGKIALSIKRTMPRPKPTRADTGKVWQPRQQAPQGDLSFEDMMSRFKSQSEEKMADLDHETNNRRGGGYAPRSRRGR